MTGGVTILQLHGGARQRQHHQSDDRRRPGAGRRRARHRQRAVRMDEVRRRRQSADHDVPGLSVAGVAATCRAADIEHVETPNPLNPLGVKGAGEGGTIPAPAAIVAAIEDALSPFGVRFADMPLTPERIVAALRAAGAYEKLTRRMSEPVSKSPFWQFSIKFYAVPGVARGLHRIAGPGQGRREHPVLSALERHAGPRLQRRRRHRDRAPDRPLARHGGGADPQRAPRAEIAAAGDGARRRPKASAPGSRRWSSRPSGCSRRRCTASRNPSRLGRPAPSKAEAARDSVSSYQGVIGPFPPGPLDTVLSAFAKFDR